MHGRGRHRGDVSIAIRRRSTLLATTLWLAIPSCAARIYVPPGGCEDDPWGYILAYADTEGLEHIVQIFPAGTRPTCVYVNVPSVGNLYGRCGLSGTMRAAITLFPMP